MQFGAVTTALQNQATLEIASAFSPQVVERE
jgi:hypothetical protein